MSAPDNSSAADMTQEETDDDDASANTNSAVVRGCYFHTTIAHKFFSQRMLEIAVEMMEKHKCHTSKYVGFAWF